MRLTTQVLQSRSEGHLSEVEFLDLAQLSLVAIEQLHQCPKLTYLNLSHNRIEILDNLDSSRELWHLNLSHNKVKTLDGLRNFPLLGTLALASNSLDFQALKRIQHLHMVEIHLQGNQALQQDENYRMHVIDCLPRAWMLDGILVTANERQRVVKFFKDHASRADLRPVHRKLQPPRFVPSSMKKLMVNGIFGTQAKQLMSYVPLTSPHTSEIDWCRLRYIMRMFSNEIKVAGEYSSVVSYTSFSTASLGDNLFQGLDDLLTKRHEHLEQSNMLLLLLVVSLEFSLPARVIETALETARLLDMGNVKCMQLFLLEKKLRCRLCGILFSSAILDRDCGEKEALYPQLFVALRSIILSLMYKAFCGDEGALVEQHRQHSLPSSSHDFELHRQLLAAEVVQLFCLVPSFFDLLGHDSGVLELAVAATGDINLQDSVLAFQEEMRLDKVDRWHMYQRLAAFLLLRVKGTMESTTAKPLRSAKQLSQTRRAVFGGKPFTSQRGSAGPRRPKSSPIGKTQSSYVSKNRSANHLTSASTVVSWGQSQAPPSVGDSVLIQAAPKVFGRIVSFTETHAAIVEVQRAASTGAAARSSSANTEHILIDLEPLVFDQGGYWKLFVSNMLGARQRTWQSADALAGSRPSGAINGRESPPPPPSSPHCSRVNSAADINAGSSDNDSDSNTGTESGDDDGQEEEFPSTIKVQAVERRTPVTPKSREKTMTDESREELGKKSSEEFALQAHVEMVIQHLQETGLSKATVQAPSAVQAAGDLSHSRSYHMPGGLKEGPPVFSPALPLSTIGAASAVQGKLSGLHDSQPFAGLYRHALTPSMPHSGPRAVPAVTKQHDVTESTQMRSGLLVPALGPSSTILTQAADRPIPSLSKQYNRGGVPRDVRSAPANRSQTQQLPMRTVTMAFQSRPKTGRSDSWNTVHRTTDELSHEARYTPHHDPLPSFTSSCLSASVPVTVTLEISQNPMTSAARSSALRQRAWRPLHSAGRGSSSRRRRTLGAMSSGLSSF